MQTYELYLNGAQVSDDGTATRLITSTSSGEKLSLLFPSSDLDRFISALSQAAIHSARLKYQNPNVKRVLETNKFEILKHSPGNSVLISFRVQGNVDMTFQLSSECAARFEEILSATLGTRKIHVPPGPRH